jgi:hypothetical protein
MKFFLVFYYAKAQPYLALHSTDRYRSNPLPIFDA